MYMSLGHHDVLNVLFLTMVLVFKMAVTGRLPTQEGKNENGQFANRCKRRISIAGEARHDVPDT